MQSDSNERHDFQKGPKSFDGIENNIKSLSQVITKGSVAAAGINVDTPILSAIIGNLTGTLSTKKKEIKRVKCKICNCNVSSHVIFQRHTEGAKHQRKLKNLEVFSKLNYEEKSRIQKSQENPSHPFMCEICPLEVNSAIQLQKHLSGIKHKRRADRVKSFQLKKNQKNKPDKQGNTIQSVHTAEHQVNNKRCMFACYTCNILLNSRIQQKEHMNSKKHKIKQELRERLHHCLDEHSKTNSKYLVKDDAVPHNSGNPKENLTDDIS